MVVSSHLSHNVVDVWSREIRGPRDSKIEFNCMHRGGGSERRFPMGLWISKALEGNAEKGGRKNGRNLKPKNAYV